MRSDDVVIVDADRDRLGITHSVRRRMAPTATVVPADRLQLVEPEKPPQVRELRIDRSAQVLDDSPIETSLHLTCEPGGGEHGGQCPIQVSITVVISILLRCQNDGGHERDVRLRHQNGRHHARQCGRHHDPYDTHGLLSEVASSSRSRCRRPAHKRTRQNGAPTGRFVSSVRPGAAIGQICRQPSLPRFSQQTSLPRFSQQRSAGLQAGSRGRA